MTRRLCWVVALLLAAPVSAQTTVPQQSERARILEQAAAELAAGRRTEAARLLASAADRLGSVQALLQLARLQSSDGDAASALESLRKARSIAPNSEDVLSAYAQVSLAAGAPVPAILTLESLTRMCSTVAPHYYLLGVALMQAGDMPAAVESLQQADRLEPNNTRTLVALGLALNSRKLYADAKPILVRGLELDPEALEALAALAESEEGLGELQAADDHARRVIAKIVGHATANTVLGMVLMKQERYAEARDAFLRALTTNPSSAKAHYQLGLAYARLGDDAGSQKQLELYRQKLREAEERVKALRRAVGPSFGEKRP